MYISVNAYDHDCKPIVEYRESFDSYSFKFGSNGLLVLNSDQMEHLYNEMLGAMMHRRYYKDELENKEESWAN